ncbi:MAG TPA: substrate-binding domain-containing protein, partial [Pirellulaceae bacterium]|nr:substrate-binding domain-containing protein [Pirellulaceae bacterium]
LAAHATATPLPTTSRLVGLVQADYTLADGTAEPTTRHISRLILDGALEAARQCELELIVQRAAASELPARVTRLANATPLAGFLFASLGEEKLVRRLTGRGLPMVLVDHDAPLAGVSTLRDDSAGGARLAIEHLAQLGHRRIAIAYWKATDLNPWRLQGYRDTLRLLGLPRRRQWEIMTDLGRSGASEVVTQWQAMSPRPTAIYCFNNSLALQVHAALLAAGHHVPRDVSLVGGGGEASTELTHHQCDWQAMGREGLHLLADAIVTGGTARCEHRLLPHRLHRGATAAAVNDAC